MKALMICALLGVSGVLFGEEVEMKFAELLEYKGVTVTKIEPDGVSIMHESGLAKIPFEKLTPELQAKFGGFDPVKAAEFRKRLNKAESAYHRAIDKETAVIETRKNEEKLEKVLDEIKLPTKIEVIQITSEGALCKARFKMDTEVSVPVTDAFGNKGSRKEIKKVWSLYGEDWYYITGLPGSLVDGSNWEGWTLVDGRHTYATALGASKTVRKLKVVD